MHFLRTSISTLLFFIFPAAALPAPDAGMPFDITCQLTGRDGKQHSYRLHLERRMLRDYLGHDAGVSHLESHWLDGELYLSVYWTAEPREIGNAIITYEALTVERSNTEEAGRRHMHRFDPKDLTDARKMLQKRVNKDFLGPRGLSTNDIKRCLKDGGER